MSDCITFFISRDIVIEMSRLSISVGLTVAKTPSIWNLPTLYPISLPDKHRRLKIKKKTFRNHPSRCPRDTGGERKQPNTTLTRLLLTTAREGHGLLYINNNIEHGDVGETQTNRPGASHASLVDPLRPPPLLENRLLYL